MGRRRYHTGIKRVDDTITTWMVTLLIPLDVNMPINLMDIGITDAHTVTPEIGGTSHSRKKYSAALHRNHQETEQLQDIGFVIHSIWSCDYMRERHMLGDDVPLPKEKFDPINIRDLYFGGRANAIVLHSEFLQNSKGAYVDFCSLYPYILKYERYPIGHPTHVTNDFSPLFKVCCRMQSCPMLGTAVCQGWHWRIPYFGLMKVKILPPCKLLFPVLPIKISGKLMFPLCHACAENGDKGLCTCPFQSHALIHTWCTSELTLAINMGYDTLEIYELLHWPSNENNRQ